MTENQPYSAYENLIQFLYRAPIGLLETNLAGDIEMINPMAASLLIPMSPNGQLDNFFAVLADVAPQLPEMTNALKDATGTVCESVRVLFAGHGIAAKRVLSISVLKIDAYKLMVSLSDVTLEAQREQAGLEMRLNAAARTDSLTKMPNRDAVRDFVRESLKAASAEPGNGLGVVFINCDRFTQINDSLGHAVGDEVLGLIAERLRSTLRQRKRLSAGIDQGAMAARVGGDEFVVVFADLAAAEDIHAIAQRLLNVLGQPYGVRTHQVHCSFSMGAVLPAQISGDADAVLRDAGTAMVEAKRAGGARYVVFEPDMRVRAAWRGRMEDELRTAIAENQLFVLYQPVVGIQDDAVFDAGDDRSAGVEALVRWNHCIRGVIAPAEFIGVAEDCGLICALGEFVLRTACLQFMDWKRELGERAPRLLAVNLSRGQLAGADFIVSLQDILVTSGMAPGDLQLEVTESLAAQDAKIQASLQEIKALGVRLALDDFGTGYSSLSSLHLLPVDTIKIDSSFVKEAVYSPHHRVLIEAVVLVAKSLHMSTVAEGIETAEQLAIVRELGCEKVQGYFFSRPITATKVVKWLAAAELDGVHHR